MKIMHSPRALSQVFLVDRDYVKRIANSLALRGKTVLEIGAGTGVLTHELCKHAKRVIAIEVDRRLEPNLLARLSDCKNVEVNFVDALDFPLRGYKTIYGNLPYHLSSAILFKILDSDFDDAVLCLQKEFAVRLAALPASSDYSRLTVFTQAACEVKILFDIPRFAFTPIPSVDSTVVHLHKRVQPVKLNHALVTALFQHKNQSVKNALKHSRTTLGKSVVELITSLDSVLAGKKVRMLSLEELKKISEKLS